VPLLQPCHTCLKGHIPLYSPHLPHNEERSKPFTLTLTEEAPNLTHGPHRQKRRLQSLPRAPWAHDAAQHLGRKLRVYKSVERITAQEFEDEWREGEWA
jgi:hypothetical protein